jgi:hypothetical protein
MALDAELRSYPVQTDEVSTLNGILAQWLRLPCPGASAKPIDFLKT